MGTRETLIGGAVGLLKSVAGALVALLFSLVVGGVVIAVSGYSPIETYTLILKGAFNSPNSFFLALREATPLLFTGLAFAVTFKVGIINIGAEGQLLLGGFVAALIGAYVDFLPAPYHLIAAILGGAIAGGLVGWLTGLIKVRFNAHEAITCIMLNSIIGLFVNFLCNGPLKPENASNAQTKRILETARLAKIVPKTQLTYGLAIVIVIAVVMYFIQKKTVFGYKMRVTGMNRLAGEVAGINSAWIYLVTFFISGAIAGIGGADITLGVLYRNIDPISSGYGFEGISVAALAGYNPVAAIFSAILFGILKAGAMQVNRTTSIPFEFVKVVQVMVVVAITAPRIVTFLPELIAARKGRAK